MVCLDGQIPQELVEYSWRKTVKWIKQTHKIYYMPQFLLFIGTLLNRNACRSLFTDIAEPHEQLSVAARQLFWRHHR